MRSIAKSITARNKRAEDRQIAQLFEIYGQISQAIAQMSYVLSGQRRVDETVELFREVEQGKRSWASAYRAMEERA